MSIFLYIVIGIIFAGFVYYAVREEAAKEDDVAVAFKIVILTFIWPVIALLITGYVVKLLVDKYAP